MFFVEQNKNLERETIESGLKIDSFDRVHTSEHRLLLVYQDRFTQNIEMPACLKCSKRCLSKEFLDSSVGAACGCEHLPRICIQVCGETEELP